MQFKKPIRWGIIGCGKVTELKSGPPYQLTPDFELKMVMRRNEEKARDYAIRHRVPYWTTDADELINNPEIDAIYIATPPDSHKYYALKVAQAKKPCCVEKPMAPCYEDSLAIYEAFKNQNIPLFIAYYRRSLPRFLKIKEWLDQNKIGEVRHLRWLKTRTASPIDLGGSYNWRTDSAIAPGGYFDDLASHGLDLFCFLLGNIKTATGVATNQQDLYSAFDAITGSWMHASGVVGSGLWNFGSHEPKDEVVITGEKGEIRFSVLDEAPIVLVNEDTKESLFIPHPKHVQEFHVLNIKKHLVGEGTHPSLGKSGLHTSWVMDRILGTIN